MTGTAPCLRFISVEAHGPHPVWSVFSVAECRVFRSLMYSPSQLLDWWWLFFWFKFSKNKRGFSQAWVAIHWPCHHLLSTKQTLLSYGHQFALRPTPLFGLPLKHFFALPSFLQNQLNPIFVSLSQSCVNSNPPWVLVQRSSLGLASLSIHLFLPRSPLAFRWISLFSSFLDSFSLSRLLRCFHGAWQLGNCELLCEHWSQEGRWV